MFGLGAALMTEKCVMKIEVSELKLLRFLLKITKRNKMSSLYILRKIGGKAREIRPFFSVK